MFEPIAPVITAAGALGGLYLALARGWLYTGRSVQDLKDEHASKLTELREGWNARLREAHERENDWRAAHGVQVEISRTATAQTGELMQSFGVLEQFIRSTPAAIAAVQRLHSVPPPENTEGTG